jgi:hypothetical protein
MKKRIFQTIFVLIALGLLGFSIVYARDPRLLHWRSRYSNQALLGKTSAEVVQFLGKPDYDSRVYLGPYSKDPVCLWYDSGKDTCIIELTKDHVTNVNIGPICRL